MFAHNNCFQWPRTRQRLSTAGFYKFVKKSTHYEPVSEKSDKTKALEGSQAGEEEQSHAQESFVNIRRDGGRWRGEPPVILHCQPSKQEDIKLTHYHSNPTQSGSKSAFII